MSTPENNDTRSKRFLRQELARHNESKINSLNAHELFVAKTMVNFPPIPSAIRSLHFNQVTISNLSSTDPMLLKKNMDPGQQLFEQLTLCGRKRDRLLVPDLATEWFRKQKVFLDKISPEELQPAKLTLLSNSQKCEYLVPTKQYSEQRLARRQELKKRRLCRLYLQSKSISCTRLKSNQEQPFRKRYVSMITSKAGKGQTATEQQTKKDKNVQRNPITLCNPYESGCGGSSQAFCHRCTCKQTWNKRNSYSRMFQADGQSMSGDCLRARRTEPLLQCLRKKYDLRKAPQRRLDPTHFRRISPEFYSLLKRYEDGMTQRYPLYGISMRHWSETKPFCPCQKRKKYSVDQCLGDEAVKSLTEKPKTQMISASSKYSHNKNVNSAVGDGGDLSTQQATTATIESSTKVHVPCTTKTCTALKHGPSILNCQCSNTCHLQSNEQDQNAPLSAKSNIESTTATIESSTKLQVPCTTKTCTALKHGPSILNCQCCNTCHLQSNEQDQNTPLSAKSNIGICDCSWTKPPENEVNSKDLGIDTVRPNIESNSSTSQRISLLRPCCHISRCVDSSVPTYEATAAQSCASHCNRSSPISTSQDRICTEHFAPESRYKHTSIFGNFACICKRALLPGRHLLYNFNNRYRQHREVYDDKHTSKRLLTKQHSKQPYQRSQHIHSVPAPCCWHLRKGPDVFNSNTTLKTHQNVYHSCCQQTDSQTLECSCSGIGGYESSEKKKRTELTNTWIPSSSHINPHIKSLPEKQKCNISYQDAGGYESSCFIAIPDDTEKKRRTELTNTCIPSSSHINPHIKCLPENQKCNILYQDATESYEQFFRQCEHPKSQYGASHNLPREESSITIKFCTPPHQNSQITASNRIICCANDKCTQSNIEDIAKKKLLKCDCSLLTDPKPKTKKKISVNTKGACLLRKFPCKRACFLASDYLQLMRRVARKRANTVALKRKSVRLKNSSQERSPFQSTQNLATIPLLYLKSSYAKNFTTKMCQSRKPSLQCPKQQSQKKSEAKKISNSQTSYPLKQKSCYVSSNSQPEEPNCNQSGIEYRKTSTFNKNGSLDSSPDIHSSLLHQGQGKATQNLNNVQSKLTEFVKSQYCLPYWTDKSRSSDSSSSNRLRSQNTVDQTSLSCKQNGSFSSCSCELRPISSHRNPAEQQKNKMDCSSSSSSASYIRSSSSGYEKAGIFFPSVHTQNHNSGWLLPGLKKKTTGPIMEQTGESSYKEPGNVILSSNNITQDMVTSMPSKMNCDCVTFCHRQINGNHVQCFQHNVGFKTKLNEHPNLSQHKNFDFKKHSMAMTNGRCKCDISKTIPIQKPRRWQISKITSKIFERDLGPKYSHQSISLPVHRIGGQRCYWKGNHHMDTQIKAAEYKKKERFAIRRLGHSTSLAHALTSNTNNIYWPRVPAPSLVSMTTDALDIGYKLKQVPKDNQSSEESIQYTNGCCNPVICNLTKIENSSEQQQNIYMEASSYQSQQLHKRPCPAKFLNHKPAVNKELIQRRMALEKKPKQRYNHNHAQLLLRTRRPPPSQLRTLATHDMQQHNWGLKEQHICQPPQILQFDDQDKAAYKTEKKCYDILDEKKDYKRLNFTQRSNSGYDVPLQKGVDQFACSNDKQRHHHCNYRHSSLLSVVPHPHPKQKLTASSGSGYIYKSTSKQLRADTVAPNLQSREDNDSLSPKIRTGFVNDEIYMMKSDRSNGTRPYKFISNAETPNSQNSGPTSYNTINTKPLLVSQFAKPTMEWRRKCWEKVSSTAPSHKGYINRHFLRPVSVVSDLDFYTHSSERMPPTLQPALRQGENYKHTYTKPPTSSAIFRDNLRSTNISPFPLPTMPVNTSKSTTCTLSLELSQSAAHRRYYFSSSDTDDN